jgi:hemerythrin superfamily protein
MSTKLLKRLLSVGIRGRSYFYPMTTLIRMRTGYSEISNKNRSRDTSSTSSPLFKKSPPTSFKSRPTDSMNLSKKDVISLIKNDHEVVSSLFNEYKSTPINNYEYRQELVHKMIRELSIHAATEEMSFYPNIRKYLSNEEAEHSLQEHATAKQILSALDQLDPKDPNYDPLVQKLMVEINHHVEEEEAKLLPKLQQRVNNEILIEMGQSYESYKIIAPTRPHLLAPDKGISAKIVNAATKPIDVIRDTVSGRNTEQSERETMI